MYYMGYFRIAHQRKGVLCLFDAFKYFRTTIVLILLLFYSVFSTTEHHTHVLYVINIH